MVDETPKFGDADTEGKIRNVVGSLTGDVATLASGKWNQAAGIAQKTFGGSPEVSTNHVVEQVSSWLLELWGYAAFMAVALSLIVVFLAGNVLLVIPVVVVCLIAGGVGTILAVKRGKLLLNENTPYESIFD